MRYDALKQLRRGERVRCQFEGPGPEDTGQVLAGPVWGDLLLIPTGLVVLARGRVRAPVQLECARCLRPHLVVLDIPVERECSLRQIDEPNPDPTEARGIPPIPIVRGEEIDLSELVRQLIVIYTPPRSLCRPDCKGLCPQCGRDLNEGPCGCAREAVDKRLAPLKALLDAGAAGGRR
jgi:uncharacterized protein